MSSPNSVTEQRKAPAMPSLQDDSKKDQGGMENLKGAGPRCGQTWTMGLHRRMGVSQPSGKRTSALGTFL